MKRRFVSYLLMTLLPVAAAVADAHRFDVRVDPALARLTVKACPAGSPSALRARDGDAGRYLLYAHRTGTTPPLQVEGNRISLGQQGACIDYAVDLGRAARTNRRYGHVGKGNVAVSPSFWLWRPVGQGGYRTEVAFRLPAGMEVSVPWTPIPTKDPGVRAYSIPASPKSDDAVSVFGRFDNCEVPIPGGHLRAAVLGGQHPGRTRDLIAWLESAASNVALAYGRFPNPNAQVIVVPTATSRHDRGEPVPFGHVIRDGGEAVQFFVNQTRPLAKFIADWTATHEFAHLMIPYISNDENWISEGLASYYQNVLMARAGAYTSEKAWRKIIEGFARGENAVPHLSLENAMPLGRWDGIMKTYWGGAAIFLRADLELRARSGNAESLDTVLEKLQVCCLPSSRLWNGRMFFRKLDSLSSRPLFEQLYDGHRGSSAFPDYRASLRALGLTLDSGRVRLSAEAPHTGVRDAIMARTGAPAVATAQASRCNGDLARTARRDHVAAGSGFR